MCIRDRALSADIAINASTCDDVPAAVRDATGGGARVSIDALGHPQCARDSILSLAKLGVHVQVGLLPDGATPLPMNAVIGRELSIAGSHGLAVNRYPEVLEMVTSGRLNPGRLLSRTLTLDQLPAALMAVDQEPGTGVSVVTAFL